MKFRGAIEVLKEIVEETGARGAWRVLPDGAYQFRAENRAILNWWPSTGTILCQGPDAAARELAAFVEPSLPVVPGLFG